MHAHGLNFFDSRERIHITHDTGTEKILLATLNVYLLPTNPKVEYIIISAKKGTPEILNEFLFVRLENPVTF